MRHGANRHCDGYLNASTAPSVEDAGRMQPAYGQGIVNAIICASAKMPWGIKRRAHNFTSVYDDVALPASRVVDEC